MGWGGDRGVKDKATRFRRAALLRLIASYCVLSRLIAPYCALLRLVALAPACCGRRALLRLARSGPEDRHGDGGGGARDGDTIDVISHGYHTADPTADPEGRMAPPGGRGGGSPFRDPLTGASVHRRGRAAALQRPVGLDCALL